MKRALAVAALFLTAACGGPTSSSTLGSNREKFETLVGDDYTVRFQRGCFCPTELTAPVLMTVKDGAIVSLVRDDGTTPSADLLPLFLTVEQVFAQIDEALAKRRRGRFDEVRVTYDPQFGHPVDVWLDESFQIADEEQGYTLSNLQPTR
jgi:hypothetical protein